MRYFAEIAYDGTDFHGWQIQPNAISVQETIEKALSTILRKSISIYGCGRTDTGVHSSQYFVHFEHENKLTNEYLYKINSILPKSIAFNRIIKVHDEAHARFDAEKRTYHYFIHHNKSPFKGKYSYLLPNYELDFEMMEKGAEFLKSIQYFDTFCKVQSDNKTTICEIFNSEWIKTENELTFTITANRFLRGMVRLIVGSLINLGRRKINFQTFKQTILDRKPFKNQYAVPPQGLFLSKIEYPFISEE